MHLLLAFGFVLPSLPRTNFLQREGKRMEKKNVQGTAASFLNEKRRSKRGKPGAAVGGPRAPAEFRSSFFPGCWLRGSG